MTISTDVSTATLAGNGVTTSFPFAFKVWKTSQVKCYLKNADGDTSETTDFSVALSESGAGGTVTYPVAGSTLLPTGWYITIIRDMPFLQENSFVNGAMFYPSVIEDMLDTATAERQQLKEAVDRCVKVAPGKTSEGILETLLAQVIAYANQVAANTQLVESAVVGIFPAASTSQAGVLKLASVTEATTGTDVAKGMTSQDVAAAILSGTGCTATAGGTADAITATIPSALTTLSNGMHVVVRAAAMNTTTVPTLAVTLGSTATGAKTIQKYGGAPLLPGDIATGHWCLFTYDGTSSAWTLLNPAQAVPIPCVVGSSRNLTITATGTSAALSLAADEILVKDGNGAPKLLSPVSLTASTATTGANGLDTGVIATNTGYYVWVIAKLDGTTAVLLSLSATAPTMPSGYTYKALVGWTRTDATANKYPLRGKQIGNRFQYILGSNLPALPVLAQGSYGSISTPTWSAISWVGYAPANAKKMSLVAGNVGGSSICVAPNSSYGNYAAFPNCPPINQSTGPGAPFATVSEIMPETTNLYIASNNSSNFLAILGWEM